MFKKTVAALSVAGLATSAVALPSAIAKTMADAPVQIAAACNPCKANPCNPCAAAKNPCNPCAAAKNPCAAAKNPCAATNPCNPCAAKNPCNPCKPKSN